MMTWHPHKHEGPTCDVVVALRGIWLTWQLLTWIAAWSGNVAGDSAEWLCWLMTWQVNPVQLRVVGWRKSVERMRLVYARGQSWRRRVLAHTGMQHIGSSPEFHQWISLVFPYTMVCSKHVLRTLISGFGSNTLFFKNRLWYQLLGNSRNQTLINLRGSATCLLHGATSLY
jgi:hypothetical protein